MTWHPILAAVETSPGRWVMRDPDGRDYGSVELRRVTPDTLRYRAEHRGQLIGWATTLRVACERVHAAYVAAHGPGGGPVADWGELTGNARRVASSSAEASAVHSGAWTRSSPST